MAVKFYATASNTYLRIVVRRYEARSAKQASKLGVVVVEGRSVVVSFLKKKGSAKTARTVVEIPVFCKIWEEQGVFNGIAEDLPVAVFGKTYEETQSNLADAIISHLEALRELNKLKETVEYLRSQARETCFSPQEIPRSESYYRFSAAVHDSQILALV